MVGVPVELICTDEHLTADGPLALCTFDDTYATTAVDPSIATVACSLPTPRLRRARTWPEGSTSSVWRLEMPGASLMVTTPWLPPPPDPPPPPVPPPVPPPLCANAGAAIAPARERVRPHRLALLLNLLACLFPATI